MKLLQLDGLSGGGQMLRTALSLAMITGQPFRMTQIRGRRPKPGLMRQHLTCVRAACEISGGTADGAEIGSTELVFRAGKVRPGSYQFAIGTAGSTTLLFQTLLPALWHADEPSTLRLEGGTHNPMAPPVEFIDRAFLPVLATMGATASVKLLATGFAPAGGGVIECEVNPCTALKPVELLKRPEEYQRRIRVLTRHLALSIAGRVLDSALDAAPSKDAVVENREPGPGPGICCLVETDFGTIRDVASSFGESGVSAEKVGNRAGRASAHYVSSGAPVSRHLADQLLLPMALAGGGSFLCCSPDDHVATSIGVIEKFLPARFHIDDAERGCKLIRVTG